LYEDLLDDPEEVVRSLCSFLRLDYTASMFSYFERAEELIAPAAFSHRHQRIFLPPTKGLREWRTQMASKDIATFEALSGDSLDRWGYKRGKAPGLRVGFQARAMVAFAGFRRVAGIGRATKRTKRLMRRLIRRYSG